VSYGWVSQPGRTRGHVLGHWDRTPYFRGHRPTGRGLVVVVTMGRVVPRTRVAGGRSYRCRVTVSSRRGRADPLLVLLALAWLVAPPLLGFIGAFVKALALSGEQPNAYQIAQAHHWWRVALVVAVSLPAAGLALAWWVGRRRAVVVCLVALLASAGAAAAVLVDLQPAPTPAPKVIPCQAYSGGSNNCPGG